MSGVPRELFRNTERDGGATVEVVKGEAKVTIHLPMDLGDFNDLIALLSKLGYEFPYVLEAGEAQP